MHLFNKESKCHIPWGLFAELFIYSCTFKRKNLEIVFILIMNLWNTLETHFQGNLFESVFQGVFGEPPWNTL